MHPGSDVYLPACFPPESLQVDTKPTPLVLSDEDKGEVRLPSFVSLSLFTRLQLHSILVYAFFPFL